MLFIPKDPYLVNCDGTDTCITNHPDQNPIKEWAWTGPVDNVPANYSYEGFSYALKTANYDRRGKFTGYSWGSSDCNYATDLESPLVVDMASQGVDFVPPVPGVLFDILGLGIPMQISWIQNTHDVAFIALPTPDGQVRSINDLFGNNTTGPDGQKAANGFLALAKLDSDHNGFIDSKDPVFASLRLWRDTNGDAIATPDEMSTLPDNGIQSIDLNYISMVEIDQYGNQTRARSVADTVSGSFIPVFDVWFVGRGNPNAQATAKGP